MNSRKQKIWNFLRSHRLALWLVVSSLMYLGVRYIDRELAKSGIEFILYPAIDVFIEHFIIGE